MKTSIQTSVEVTERILAPQLQKLVMSAQEAAAKIKTGMTVCTSGFGTGYPKAIPTSLAESKHATELTVINGAARGDMHIGALASSGVLKKFVGFQFNGDMRAATNAGDVEFIDCHLGQLAGKIRNGYFGNIDFGIIECCKINEDGTIVPTLSAGIADTIVKVADKILIEINLAIPTLVEGLHDFGADPRTIIKEVSEHIGEPFLRVDPSKIAGIVFTEFVDTDLVYPEVAQIYEDISANVVKVLNKEIEEGRIPEKFTFQSGMGVVANCVLIGLMTEGFKGLKMYTEVLADQAMFALKEGIIDEASTTTLDISPAFFDDVFDNIEFYKEHLVLRPLEVTNGAAQIIAQDLVSMNTAWEADIYGNVNSTHAMGVQMVNGIGGSNDYCRNAKLSIFTTPSTAKNDTISRIIPMVSHVDSSEHDTDVIVTEFGYADLRGKAPKERVREIIENCAHPIYRQQLWDYYNDAVALCGPAQTPHDLTQCFSWYQRYFETGTMKQN